MTRTDVMASSRPRTVGAAPIDSASSGILGRLTALPVLLLFALALVMPSAAAAESTSGYSSTPTAPSTGTSPSKEAEKPATTPAKEVVPSTTTTTPTTTTAKASTLPFTGFDLRWDVGFGLLLMAAGFSIVVVQRRQRRQR